MEPKIIECKNIEDQLTREWEEDAQAARDAPKDWRGTPIIEGALLVYGAPVGRSIAMVEAEVVGFTKSGRVNVRVIRRSYGGYGEGKEIVHVGADRLTIVTQLPATDKPTDKEANVIRKAENAERDRIYNTHRFPHYLDFNGPWGDRPCQKCGVKSREAVTDCVAA